MSIPAPGRPVFDDDDLLRVSQHVPADAVRPRDVHRALRVAPARGRRRRGVVRVVDRPTPGGRPRGGRHLSHSHRPRTPCAADALNGFDVAIVQHEYGIYPGRRRRGRAAAAAPAHGAEHRRPAHRADRPDPPPAEALLEQIVAAAGAVVTMTGTARRPAARRLRRRPGQGLRHPARRRRHAGVDRAGRRTPAAPAHLGAARPRQGHRVGVAGPRPVCGTSTRRRATRRGADPPQGARTRRARRTGRACTGSARSSASRTPCDFHAPTSTSRAAAG